MLRKFTVTVNGIPYEVDVEEKTAAGGTAAVEKLSMQELSERKPEEQKPKPVIDPSSEKILSPMPGSILQILVNKGDEVKKGHKLCVLEAMKMETDIVSPRDALVEKIHVAKGASVNAGDILIELR